MEMGNGGAMNAIANSILINHDGHIIYSLIVIKRTGQYAPVLLQNSPAKLSLN
jgi:hypothetical protein